MSTSIEVADAILNELLSDGNHKHKRLQTGLKNVALACKHLLSKKELITIKSVSLYVDAYLDGIPKQGTIENDSKGAYTKIMTAYRACGSHSRKQTSKPKDDCSNGQNTIYVKILENRIKVLENVLSKNFKNQGVVSVSEMLKCGGNDMGTVDIVSQSPFTTNQIEAIKKLFNLLDYAEDIFEILGKEGKERVVLKINKQPLLSPSELSEIKSIINL